MWMSLVAMKVWMRGRSESLIAFQAASMSWNDVRASPQITGPCTSRAIAVTASKSPGDVIGNPASMMSAPSRASWCAISSFSWTFSEMPGDCSPSRSVVSKIRTRSSSCLVPATSLSMSLIVPFDYSTRFSSVCGSCGRRASFPPKGEEEKPEVERERHLAMHSTTPPLDRKDHLADVLALLDEAVRVGTALEREGLRHDRAELPALDPLRQRLDELVERSL